MATVRSIRLWRLSLPLAEPYRISQHVYKRFEPFVSEVALADGRTAWGEAGITPGLTHETPQQARNWLIEIAPRLIGASIEAGLVTIESAMPGHAHAASILAAPLEVLAADRAVHLDAAATVPILAPLNGRDETGLAAEIEARLAEGFKTLKVKVGFDVERDLFRVALIQRLVRGRAALRLDANQGFGQEDAVRFATRLDPTGVELFEQPCHMDDWQANAAVAAVSPVPVMLDEAVKGEADIDRAAQIPGVGYVKLKLKKIGGARCVRRALDRIRDHGLEPVLGDGSATDIGNWLEAAVARLTVSNAGEMNGFLKLKDPLLAEPLIFRDGAIHLPAGGQPAVALSRVETLSSWRASFSK